VYLAALAAYRHAVGGRRYRVFGNDIVSIEQNCSAMYNRQQRRKRGAAQCHRHRLLTMRLMLWAFERNLLDSVAATHQAFQQTFIGVAPGGVVAAKHSVFMVISA
jgi:hypothetical protein